MNISSDREAKMKKAIVVFSGGPDSTAAALWGLTQGYSIKLLTFRFKGDSQNGEIFSAMSVAKELGLPHSIIDFKEPMAHFSNDEGRPSFWKNSPKLT